MKRSLVWHDVDAVQDYVFATGRLREIRGASALIDRVNRQIGPTVASGGVVIVAGGGLFAARFDNRSTANEVRNAFEASYDDATAGGASSTGVVVEYEQPQFGTALAAARLAVRTLKDGKRRRTQLLHHPFFKLCGACGTQAAEQRVQVGSEIEFLCPVCHAKRRGSGDAARGGYPSVEAELLQALASRGITSLADDVEEIGRAARPTGYIGVVYGDGNRMGERLDRIGDEHLLRSFSHIVDHAARHAICSALARRSRPVSAPTAFPRRSPSAAVTTWSPSYLPTSLSLSPPHTWRSSRPRQGARLRQLTRTRGPRSACPSW